MAAKYGVENPVPPWKTSLDGLCDALDQAACDADVPNFKERRDEEDALSATATPTCPTPRTSCLAGAFAAGARRGRRGDASAAPRERPGASRSLGSRRRRPGYPRGAMIRRFALLLLVCVLWSAIDGVFAVRRQQAEDALRRSPMRCSARTPPPPRRPPPTRRRPRRPSRRCSTACRKDATVTVDVGEVSEDTHQATLNYSWIVGPERTFRYDATATATQSGDDWRVQWAPTVLHPDLAAGMHFQYSDDKNFLTPVTDRDGQPLMTWQTVGVVDLRRDHLASAATVGAAAAAVRADHHRRHDRRPVRRHAGRRVTVIRLREADLAMVRDQLTQISGRHGHRAGCTADRQPRPVLAGDQRPA